MSSLAYYFADVRSPSYRVTLQLLSALEIQLKALPNSILPGTRAYVLLPDAGALVPDLHARDGAAVLIESATRARFDHARLTNRFLYIYTVEDIDRRTRERLRTLGTDVVSIKDTAALTQACCTRPTPLTEAEVAGIVETETEKQARYLAHKLRGHPNSIELRRRAEGLIRAQRGTVTSVDTGRPAVLSLMRLLFESV